MKKKSLHIWIIMLSFACLMEAQTNIQIGVVYNFSQAPSSTTNYQINIPAPGEITIHINNWLSTYDWGRDYDRMYIYNSENNPVSRNQFSSSTDPFLFHMFQPGQGLTFNVGQAGLYTISVHSGEYKQIDWGTATSQNYEMSVTATYCDDSYEPNESIENATPISIGSKVAAYQWRRINTSEIWGDEDWYKITIGTPGKLRIEMVNWVGVYSWGSDYDRLYVYNADGKSIGSQGGYDFYLWMMGGGTDSVPVITEMNLTHAGTYYLRYHSGAGTGITPYHFTTSFLVADDPFEPNDDFLNAKLIPTFDTWHQAYEWRSADSTMNITGDEDYYYFMAPGEGQCTITLDGWIGIYNWGADYDRIFIYDANENSVGASPLSWMMSNSPINFTIPVAGKYYIRLHCGAGSSIDGYKFKLTGTTVDVKETKATPSHFTLEQNFPNPFNPTTKIKYSIPFESEVKIVVYNTLGESIDKLVDKLQTVGVYELNYNASPLTSGVYYYSITAVSLDGKQNYREVKKMVVLK